MTAIIAYDNNTEDAEWIDEEYLDISGKVFKVISWYLLQVQILALYYTSLFTKMVATKEKKRKNTYMQKYIINKNGSKNRNKEYSRFLY